MRTWVFRYNACCEITTLFHHDWHLKEQYCCIREDYSYIREQHEHISEREIYICLCAVSWAFMEKTAQPNQLPWRGKRSQESASDLHTLCVFWADTHRQLVFHFPWYQIAPSFQHLTVAPKRQPPGLFQGKGYFLQCVCEFLIHIRV